MRRGFYQYGEPPADPDNPVLELYRSRREDNLAKGRPPWDPNSWRDARLPVISRRDLDTLVLQAPSFTPSQRLHLEVYGYVLVEGVLSAAEARELREAILGVEESARAGTAPSPPCFVESDRPEYFRIDNLLHLGPAFFDCLTHPRILGCAQEAVGSSIRLTQSDAHVRRRGDGPDRYEFHRGTWFGGTVANDLYHYPFVKALTNLTDLGAGDGGTAVIPGTHKLAVDTDWTAIVDAALGEPSLVHTVMAPAGSTLFFFESLLHSKGLLESSKDRVLIVGGYALSMMQPASGNEPDPRLLARLPRAYRSLLDGTETFFD